MNALKLFNQYYLVGVSYKEAFGKVATVLPELTVGDLNEALKLSNYKNGNNG